MFPVRYELNFIYYLEYIKSVKTTPRVVRQKNMVMSPAGRGTKNDRAGEAQQQFTHRPSL
jgi:hypothetical protein